MVFECFARQYDDRSPTFKGEELHLKVPHEPNLPLFSQSPSDLVSQRLSSRGAWPDSQILKDLLKLDNVNLFTSFATPKRTHPESLSSLHPFLNTSLQDSFERLAISTPNGMRHASGLDADRKPNSLVLEEDDEHGGPVKGRIGTTITMYRIRRP